ncbi:MAG: hypothetical protein MJ183_07560 [Treponemataceae bacterium]|nr:hypothetical protein [Treponemataceae bacterium]
MKKLLTILIAIACMFSVSAIGIGIRADADFGVLNFEDDRIDNAHPDLQDNLDSIASGTAALWLDLPIIDLKIVSVGLRAEGEVAFNRGDTALYQNNEVSFKKTELNIPVFVSASVTLGFLRVSAGVGPYVSMPLTFTDDADFEKFHLDKPVAGWDSKTWGLAGYAQAGLKIGPGFLTADVRANAPMDTGDIFKVAGQGVSGSTELVASKTFNIGVGLGYEFKF